MKVIEKMKEMKNKQTEEKQKNIDASNKQV